MLGGSETFNSFLRKAQQVRGLEPLEVVGCWGSLHGGECWEPGPLDCGAVKAGGANVPALFLSTGDTADTYRRGGAGSAALQWPEGQGHHSYLGPDGGRP